MTRSNELLVKTANLIYQAYLKAIKEKGNFTLVLSGGRTPKIIFKELINNYQEKIIWNKVHFFWVDERCVPPSHNDSNYKLAKDHLLNSLGIHLCTVHRMQGELDPKEAALAYENDIKIFFDLAEGELPEFDLILLGMGDDGHLASLFPDSLELKEKVKMVVSTQHKYNGYKRITMTLPLINNSNKILMIGSQNKIDVFNDKIKMLPVHFLNTENMMVIS